jgi:hypothetical protein
VSSKGRLSDAVWTAFTEALRFVVVPYVLVDLVTSNYPQLATAFMDDIVLYIFFFGGMIVASSTLEAANRPGTYKRMLFGLTALAFVCMWMYVIFGGGIAEVHWGPYNVRFDMSKIVYIMLFGISLKGLIVVSTFSTARKEELKRAKLRQVERARERAEAAKARPAPKARPQDDMQFSEFSRAAFEVTADDLVGHVPEPPPIPREPGTKLCDVCGAKAPMKDYVCKNCGAWFPRDTVIRD